MNILKATRTKGEKGDIIWVFTAILSRDNANVNSNIENGAEFV